MAKKIICVDFDGVLNEYNGYEEGNLGKPLSGSQDFIKELRKKYKVVILTSRPKEQVINWLTDNGFPSMKVTNNKVPAVAYIDDRAIPFNGDYKQVLRKVKDFRPYWVKIYYRLYYTGTGETIALCNTVDDALIIGEKHYRKRSIDIEELEGVLE